jgi:hypothetical protein
LKAVVCNCCKLREFMRSSWLPARRSCSSLLLQCEGA